MSIPFFHFSHAHTSHKYIREQEDEHKTIIQILNWGYEAPSSSLALSLSLLLTYTYTPQMTQKDR